MTSTSAEGPSVERDGGEHYRMFIDGGWVDTPDHIDVVNPATEEVAFTVAKATTDHVDAAVVAARRPGVFSRSRPCAQRAPCMMRSNRPPSAKCVACARFQPPNAPSIVTHFTPGNFARSAAGTRSGSAGR